MNTLALNKRDLLAVFTIASASCFTQLAHAASCDGLPSYQAGTTYAPAARVKNIVSANGATVEFICNVPGWCSSATTWAYEPGNGAHWQQAWNQVAKCSNTGGSNQAPQAMINGPYRSMVNETVAFSSTGSTDPDGSIKRFSWNFGDGSTSNQPSTNHSYQHAGTYTVSLSVTDNLGLTSTASTSATIATSTSGGGNCLGLANYVAGSAYAAGDRVVNVLKTTNERMEYLCSIPGWCSSTAAWAYEPGNGAHWASAWNLIGKCTGGTGANQLPVANANGDYYGQINQALQLSSAGSSDADGSISNYHWSFGDGSSANGENVSHSYTQAGNFLITLTVTDNKGAVATDTATATITKDGGSNSNLPKRIINGYWHNFNNGSGFIPIAQVSPRFDVINVSFAEPTSATSGMMQFKLDPATNETQFKAGVRSLQSKGKKVLISIGGALGQVRLGDATARDNFVRSMIDIIQTYGFDGMDIDFEGHSLEFNAGDSDLFNPTTPVIVNTIDAINKICTHFGNKFILTMAPETFFVQVGHSFYGGISAGADRRAGAYLPVIHALRDKLTFLQVQNYNSGSITGLDGQYHAMGNADFHVAMIDMLLKGFTIANGKQFFPPLRQDQVLIGLPANVNAGGGFTSVAEVQQALDCLIKARNCPAYNPGKIYPNLRGLMTWSINWDKFNNEEFSIQHRNYLDALP